MRILPHLPRAVCAAVAALILNASAQEPPGSSEKDTIRSVSALVEFGSENARKNPVPVMLRGVCTYANSKRVHFFLHDGTKGVVVSCDPAICPEFGDEVIVNGVAAPGNGYVIAAANAVKVVGKGKLPEPMRVSIAESSAVKYYAQWLEIEGVVLQARTQSKAPGAMLHIAGDNGWTVVTIRETHGIQFEKLWGARVRARGLSAAGNELLIANPKDPALFSILVPGLEKPFDAPLKTVAEVVKDGATADRIRLKAIVLDAQKGWAHLRDATGAFRADFLYPYEDDSEWNAQPGGIPVPKLTAGDEVELVGSPMIASPGVDLRYAQMRVLRSGQPAEPRKIKLTEASSHVNDLVTIQARLKSNSGTSVAPGRWRNILELTQDGKTLTVVHETSARDEAMSALDADDLIEATGVIRSEDSQLSLHLRKSGDAHSLGVAPEVLRGKQTRIYSIITGAAMLAGLWIVMLRRSVAARTAEAERAKEDLTKALATERELGELKSRFVSLVSHEFRTPLGITMSAVELLRAYNDRLSPEKRTELLDDIYHATLRMSGLMEQVLLLGRVEAGKVGYQALPLHLPELCGKMTDESLSATNRKCAIEFTHEGDFNGAVGDEGMLRHIFSNLISNAVKYSPAGSTVYFHVKRESENAVFSVRDCGIGIPPEDHARLFEAFHRAGNVGEIPGTGLGLLIVKRCSELHHGSVTFESRVGEGSVFTVSVPLFSPRS